MIVVGVTGKYCAGKSTVSELLAEYGYAQIDVDRLGHEALEREAARVIETFGDAVRDDQGGVDRKALGRIVFGDESKLRALEAIVHPAMVAMTAERVVALRGGPGADHTPGVVVNAAILFRMGLESLCDTIVFVTAPLSVTLRRARERDGASIFAVFKRLRAQRDVDPQHSDSDADIHSVKNDGDRDRLREQLARLLPLP